MTPDPRPWPPGDFATRSPRITVLQAGTTLHRFFTRGRDSIYFDLGLGGRLNAPDGSYGVLYAAEQQRGAFAESFLRSPGRRQLPADLIARKAYARLSLLRDVSLLDLHGPGLAVVGATAEVTSGGEPYALPQTWSKALHEHSAAVDGIAYMARHDNHEVCYALFERARGAVVELDHTDDLEQDWFFELMNVYDVGLTPA